MKKYLAEVIGTFLLVFCGTGAIIVDQETHGVIGHAGIAMTFGLVVMSLIYALGNISGAHFNPAVSLAFTLAGTFPAKQLPGYLAGQILGGILASLILHIIFPTNAMLGSTIPSGTWTQSFILELILSFFLMLVILNVAHGSKEQGLFAGLAIGSVILLEAMFAGPICGASMNPVRSLAPAIVSGHLENVWIYLTVPVIGMAVAVPVWRTLK